MTAIRWNAEGLVPAIAQDVRSGTVLMMAWMNAEAMTRTTSSGHAWFWSRSRQALWKKGETSGNVLHVRDLRVDCDGDTVLVLVTPDGPACHTGRDTCFFRDADGEDAGALTPAPAVLEALVSVIAARKGASTERSYTRSLLDGGATRIGAKLTEEAGELAAELSAGSQARLVSETADLVFHTLVALASRDVPLEAVWAELDRRFGRSGHAEKAARPPQS